MKHEVIKNMNGSITSKEIESVIKNLPKIKNLGPNGFTSDLHQTFTEELTPILLELFQKTEEEGKLTNSFYEASITQISKPGKDTTIKENHRTVNLISIEENILNKILANQNQHYTESDSV